MNTRPIDYGISLTDEYPTNGIDTTIGIRLFLYGQSMNVNNEGNEGNEGERERKSFVLSSFNGQ